MEAAGKRYILHPSRSDWFTVWNLADLHIGNAGTADEMIARDVARIRDDPRAFWFGGGDYADYISINDRRFKASTLAKWLTAEDLGKLGGVMRRRIRETLAPIRHKCLGLLMGNHEENYQRAHHQEDLHAWLCQDLDVPNLGYSCFCDLVFARQWRVKTPKLVIPREGELGVKASGGPAAFIQFRFFLHHGAGYAQTEGGKMNKLVQFMDRFEADCYMLGHVHDQIAKRHVQLCADATCRKIVQRERVGIVTGSYLKTYQEGVVGYGEKKGYKPVPLGARFVRVRPETRELKAEI